MNKAAHHPHQYITVKRLAVNVAQIPNSLKSLNQFVLWRYQCVNDTVKKLPLNPRNAKAASVLDPFTWGSFQEVLRAYHKGLYTGIGLVLTHDLNIVGIDLDHCRKDDGGITTEALEIVRLLDSYTEISPSGKGLHILLAGSLPGLFHRRDHVEMYSEHRFFTLTGQWIPGTPRDIQPRQRELFSLYHRIFAQPSLPSGYQNTGSGIRYPQTLRSLNTLDNPQSDRAVLTQACLAKNANTFLRYYQGDTTLWQGPKARHHSQSEADFTLVLLLLYWTCDNVAQVDRLFRQSGLMRPKWDRRLNGTETYGQRLIKDALLKRYGSTNLKEDLPNVSR
ncbi:phage NrS-1 polymerase family protein [Dictyobacter formicarum]|uniref:NrS-1 polymerase-like HBD domain-containing protein n=1 Tax=Dictyobacter formicarum TaxID=2778368 RepID=A0ABQ3VHL1_9CHLR|nr:hypothetical protein [Dictyobacter formicarum]GHO85189.1 hypothetical protein KSZ_31950 [Dictyobacter formicarum]